MSKDSVYISGALCCFAFRLGMLWFLSLLFGVQFYQRITPIT